MIGFKTHKVWGFLILLATLLTPELSLAKETTDAKMTASEAFAAMPLSVLDMVDKSRRLDMLDYYAVDSIAKVPNTMEGVSYLEKVTPDYLKVCLTPVSTMTIKILPSKKGDIVMVAYTVGSSEQAYDTDLKFYDSSFNELKRDKFIRDAELYQYFNLPDKEARAEIESAITFPTVRYVPDVNGTGLTAELTVGKFLSLDGRKLLKKYIKPMGLRYSWDGSKFNLDK